MRPGPGREPLLTYEMAPRDLDRLRRSITILAEMAIAAGAREVFTSIFGFPPITLDGRGPRPWSARATTRAASSAWPSTRWAARAPPTTRGAASSTRAARASSCPGSSSPTDRSCPPASGSTRRCPIMSMATRIAWRLGERFPRLAGRARARRGDVGRRSTPVTVGERRLTMRPTVLLFDIDGTLVDTGGAGRRSIERAFERLPRPARRLRALSASAG